MNSDCVRPNFLFGVSSNSRKYTIKVSESFFSNKAGLFQFTNFFLALISFPEQLLRIIRRMNIKNKYVLTQTNLALKFVLYLFLPGYSVAAQGRKLGCEKSYILGKI